ncbi:MAG TPA: hypothetical protein VK658_05765 [Chryseolinea sp.]|nr:hypothetical protein [Chryseolinea sp.]
MIIWKTLLISLLVFTNEALFGQPPQTVLDIIDRLLFHPKVYKFAFVAYMKDEAYTFNQPTDMVAFIMPDTTLRKVYPQVLADIAYSWGAERMLEMRTLSTRPEGTILVTNGFYHNPRIRLLIQFMKFDFTDTDASIEFRVTSEFNNKELANHYVRIWAKIVKANGAWKVERVRCKGAPWRHYMFKGDENYDPNLVPYKRSE